MGPYTTVVHRKEFLRPVIADRYLHTALVDREIALQCHRLSNVFQETMEALTKNSGIKVFLSWYGEAGLRSSDP
jgi:hypothetical protein